MTLVRPESLRVPSEIAGLAGRFAAAGGRLLLVGGWVRDGCLGRSARDLDLELYDVVPRAAREILREAGLATVESVGRSFPVLLARGPGFEPFELSVVDAVAAVAVDGGFEERAAAAARRRDLTINAMALDPLTHQLFDAHGGWADLAAKRLRAVDSGRFGDDPLRVLRVARFGASLGATPDRELQALCREQDLSGVAVERLHREMEGLLAGEHPSIGLALLRETGGLRVFPELAALEGVPQDPRWHPEGCVWTHTQMVVDEAVRQRTGDATRDRWLMWSALLHDLGKPETTSLDADAIRSHGHDARGALLTRRVLERLRAPSRSVTAIEALVRHHLAPALLVGQNAGDRGYRRLARRLAAAGVDAVLLERLARSDHFGRTTDEALARRFEAGDAFLERMIRLETIRGPVAPKVRGRDVVARGIPPGPRVGAVLARCIDIEDETGWKDASRILERALREDRGDD